jgi:hypothetical protein
MAFCIAGMADFYLADDVPSYLDDKAEETGLANGLLASAGKDH